MPRRLQDHPTSCHSFWVRDNPDHARAVLEQHQEFVDQFGICLFEPMSASMTLAEIAKWIDGRARTGCRIIAVDPITAGAARKCAVFCTALERYNAFFAALSVAPVGT